MRIVAWNCCRAFRKKVHHALALKPDIIVVPECENPETCKEKAWLSHFATWRWFGDNKHQGVGLFFCQEMEVTACDWFDPEIKFIKPYYLKGMGFEFTMIPVWANNAQSPRFRYIGQVGKFLERYPDRLLEQEVMMLGDFNSNTIWDTPSRSWNHSQVVQVLKEQEIESLYHVFNGIEHGSEPEKTFYLYRKQDKGYHIDYIFASRRFRQQLRQVTVGAYNEWYKYSDHCPLICDFD